MDPRDHDQQNSMPDRYSTPRYLPRRSPAANYPAQRRRGSGGKIVLIVMLLTVGMGIWGFVYMKKSEPPTSTKALQQELLSYGPGGDIPANGAPFPSSGCLNWTPKRGEAFPVSGASMGCHAPHPVEFFESGEPKNAADKTATYPASQQWLAEGGAACTKKFFDEAYVALPNKEDTLKVWLLVPSAVNWQTKIENGYATSIRKFYCYVSKADGTPLTGPLNGK